MGCSCKAWTNPRSGCYEPLEKTNVWRKAAHMLSDVGNLETYFGAKLMAFIASGKKRSPPEPPRDPLQTPCPEEPRLQKQPAPVRRYQGSQTEATTAVTFRELTTNVRSFENSSRGLAWQRGFAWRMEIREVLFRDLRGLLGSLA